MKINVVLVCWLDFKLKLEVLSILFGVKMIVWGVLMGESAIFSIQYYWGK